MRAKANTLLAATAIFALFLSLLTGCQVNDAEPGNMEDVASVERVERANWEWSPNAECSSCHVLETETTEDSACAAALTTANPCLPCHNDNTALERVHAIPFDDQPGKRLRSTEVSNEACANCHALSELAAATQNQITLVDSVGTVANPHALPASESHSTLTCSSCHRPHDEAPLAETTRQACLSCHHQNVFECGTCHS